MNNREFKRVDDLIKNDMKKSLQLYNRAIIQNYKLKSKQNNILTFENVNNINRSSHYR